MTPQPDHITCVAFEPRLRSRVIVDVVIPALNEEQSLELVLRDLPPVRTVYVVDNGSSDGTARIAGECGAIVVEQPQRGYGAACLAGLSVIRNLTVEGVAAPDVVVFLDADYSDHPQQLTSLIEPIELGEADFVLGSRLLGNREPGAMPPQSVYGNRLACFLMNRLFGSQYTDLGPFRAIAYSSLCQLEMADENFGWTIEMQIKATRLGLRTLEVPVDYRRRIGSSKISGTINGTVRAGSKILLIIAKYGMQRQKKQAAAERNVHATLTPKLEHVQDHLPSHDQAVA